MGYLGDLCIILLSFGMHVRLYKPGENVEILCVSKPISL